MGFNELKQHGTADFPIQLYRLDKSAAKFEMVHHWHREQELIRVLRGELITTVDRTEKTLCAGQSILVNSDSSHAAHPRDDTCEYECVVFDVGGFVPSQPDLRGFLYGFLSGQRRISERASDDPTVRAAVDRLFSVMEEVDSENRSRFEVIAALYGLFAAWERGEYSELYEPIHDADENTTRLKKALTLIRSSYREDLTLSQMAACCEMSPQHFCSCFRAMTNRSPMEYLNYYRLAAAVKMLVNTDETVTQIAYSCGFNDLSYFIKQFKNEKGVSPGRFRKQLSEKDAKNEKNDTESGEKNEKAEKKKESDIPHE